MYTFYPSCERWPYSPACLAAQTQTQPLRALTRQDPVCLPSSVLFTFIFLKVQKLLFSLPLWLIPIMQSHRSACCQGKVCLDTKECIKGFSFEWVSLSCLKRSERSANVSSLPGEFSCLFTRACPQWPQKGVFAFYRVWQHNLGAGSPGRCGVHAFFSVMWQQGDISDK